MLAILEALYCASSSNNDLFNFDVQHPNTNQFVLFNTAIKGQQLITQMYSSFGRLWLPKLELLKCCSWWFFVGLPKLNVLSANYQSHGFLCRHIGNHVNFIFRRKSSRTYHREVVDIIQVSAVSDVYEYHYRMNEIDCKCHPSHRSPAFPVQNVPDKS